MKVVVTIPTYNEIETIGEVIDRLKSTFRKMRRHDFFILVIDGNSPDGTGDLVKEKGLNDPTIKLLKEDEKAGLGAAYIQGFRHAMYLMDADVLVEMDGDLQHKPEDILKLMKEIDGGADYVIGSRFIEGGSIPKTWATFRKFLSIYGSKFARFVLGIKEISDFTSGFKATRVKNYMEKIDLNDISSDGFSYKIEFLYRLCKMGAKIKEVPIDFGLRDRGTSKMEAITFVESLYLVLKLRALEYKTFLLFAVVGVIGFLLDVVFLTFMCF